MICGFIFSEAGRCCYLKLTSDELEDGDDELFFKKRVVCFLTKLSSSAAGAVKVRYL